MTAFAIVAFILALLAIIGATLFIGSEDGPAAAVFMVLILPSLFAIPIVDHARINAEWRITELRCEHAGGTLIEGNCVEGTIIELDKE